MAGWKYSHGVELLYYITRKRVQRVDCLDLVTKELNPGCKLVVDRDDFQGVALDAEIAS